MWSDQHRVNPNAQKLSPSALAQVFEPIRDDLREVEREFARHMQSQVDVIPAIGKYVKEGGGKRIRPAVLLMSATLVHDDIIDESELRRGREAAHTRWGNHLTVLFGDFLYLKSMSLALTQDNLDVIRLLCDVTLRIVEGEIYQLTKNGVVDLSEEEHFDIVRRKTAHLFAGSAKIGGMLGPTTVAQQDALWDYGFNIGMAFQIVDDLLDFTGEQVALGKPVGGDLREGKMTLPVIHLLSHGDGRADVLIRKIVRDRDATANESRELQALLVQAQSIDYARSTASDFVERAKRALDAFPSGPERDALIFLPDYVLARDR
jgi:octaprenyl-diphosphate synthase